MMETRRRSRRPTDSLSSGGSSSSSVDLPKQLDEIQQAYRRMQTAAAHDQLELQLSVNPAIPARRIAMDAPAAAAAAGSSSAAFLSPLHSPSAGLAYDARRRTLSALTLELIMTLRMNQLLKLRESFDQHGGVVSVAQFVGIMAAQLDIDKLHTTPDIVSRQHGHHANTTTHRERRGGSQTGRRRISSCGCLSRCVSSCVHWLNCSIPWTWTVMAFSR